jgi:hypothetical protein
MKQSIAAYSLVILFVLEVRAFSQNPPNVTQRDSVKGIFNEKKVSINYGKPAIHEKKIFGSYVPYFRIWRTGAGAATTLTTEADLEMDGAIIPQGVYTLYTLPTEERWKLIINKQTGQWGTIYNSQFDLARLDLKITKLRTQIRDLTFKLEKNGNGGGLLKIEWENTSLSVPFHVSKDALVPSPLDSSVIVLKDNRISVNYSRPSMRGRKIMGGVVPYGIVWRTGANAATSFTTLTDIVVSGVAKPRGSYTLYTLPSSKQWKLIISKQTGQWGTVYNEKLDLASIPLKKLYLKQPVEKFTMSLEQTAEKTGVMKLAWEKTQLSVNFQLK